MISPAFGLALEARTTDPTALAGCYGPWNGVRSNHVITQLGMFTGSDGSSRSISTEADRQLLVALRSFADLLVVDAATARKEAYGLPSSGAAIAIFSRTGDFSGIPALEQSTEKVSLFSPTPPENFGGHRHFKIESLDNPLQEVSAWAQASGLIAVLLEAGPTLTKTAFDNQMVGQSAVTIAGAILDIDAASKAHPFDSKARLLSMAHSEDSTFTYWTH